jgi:hypothetical protein
VFSVYDLARGHFGMVKIISAPRNRRVDNCWEERWIADRLVWRSERTFAENF